MSPVDDSAVNVACRFVRGRNALLCAADFGPVFMDFYLHLGQTGVVLAQGMDKKLKTLLAALTLHAAAQPRTLTCAWTVHLEDAGVNLFAVAENPSGLVTGQAFERQVRAVGGNVLHAETAGPDGLRRRSSVEFAGGDLLVAAAAFYASSEQRGARYFRLGGDAFALLVAQPDADLDWLQSAGSEEIEQICRDGNPPLETRVYRFGCGCTAGKIAEAIAPALRGDLDAIFGGDSHIRVSCPRCGARHELQKSQLVP
jgi:molecular chaperone Hsp33